MSASVVPRIRRDGVRKVHPGAAVPARRPRHRARVQDRLHAAAADQRHRGRRAHRGGARGEHRGHGEEGARVLEGVCVQHP